MNHRLGLRSMAAAVLLSGLYQPAFAFTAGACKEDEQKYCADSKPEDRRDCMKKNESSLSPACQENITEAKQKMEKKMADVKAACKDDLQKYCTNVTPGQGREIACLKSYNDKISASCKEALPKHMKHHKGMRHHDHEDHDDAPPQK